MGCCLTLISKGNHNIILVHRGFWIQKNLPKFCITTKVSGIICLICYIFGDGHCWSIRHVTQRWCYQFWGRMRVCRFRWFGTSIGLLKNTLDITQIFGTGYFALYLFFFFILYTLAFTNTENSFYRASGSRLNSRKYNNLWQALNRSRSAQINNIYSVEVLLFILSGKYRIRIWINFTTWHLFRCRYFHLIKHVTIYDSRETTFKFLFFLFDFISWLRQSMLNKNNYKRYWSASDSCFWPMLANKTVYKIND